MKALATFLPAVVSLGWLSGCVEDVAEHDHQPALGLTVQALSGCSPRSTSPDCFPVRVMMDGRPAVAAGYLRVVRSSTGFALFLKSGIGQDAQFHSWASGPPQIGPAIGLWVKTSGKWNLISVDKAWVSEYQAVPTMDPNANATEIKTLQIEYSGFTPDDDDEPEPT